jgi:hypothetical protein
LVLCAAWPNESQFGQHVLFLAAIFILPPAVGVVTWAELGYVLLAFIVAVTAVALWMFLASAILIRLVDRISDRWPVVARQGWLASPVVLICFIFFAPATASIVLLGFARLPTPIQVPVMGAHALA